MSMVIKNNMPALFGLGQLNKNISNAAKDLKKLSSGAKINGAGDSASGYAISRKMQVHLRSLDQDVYNVKNGSSLLNIAAGGIGNIVEELRTLKELAINAANDTNTDEDRATIQKEFDNRRANIDDIATTTNYNGRVLLMGDYGRHYKPLEMLSSNATYPNGVTNVYSGGGITSGGVWDISGATGNINISAAAVAAGVRLTSDGNTLSGVNITVDDADALGGANLWIDGLNINNSASSIIKFSGANNTLSVTGDNTFTGGGGFATINVGGGLLVSGEGSHSLNITNISDGAAIGSDFKEQLSNSNIGVLNLNFEAHVSGASAIGSGAGNSTTVGDGASIGDIVVQGSNLKMTGGVCSLIGSGTRGCVAGDLYVLSSTIEVPQTIDTIVGSGYKYSACGNITVDNCYMDVHNSDSALIGAGDNLTNNQIPPNSGCGNIRVSRSEIYGSSTHGAGIGSGRDAQAGDITIVNMTRLEVSSVNGTAIGSGKGGKVGDIKISDSSIDEIDTSNVFISPIHDPDFPGIGPGFPGEAWQAGDIGDIGIVEDDSDYWYSPLYVHSGTKANQNIAVQINDMRPETMLLDRASVTTRDNAVKAIRKLDAAINYALDEATNVGSYISRLEYTEANLVTASENTQAAESVITDADMAQEAMNYARDSILSQSSQSMLAQANQNASGVLSLLQ